MDSADLFDMQFLKQEDVKHLWETHSLSVLAFFTHHCSICLLYAAVGNDQSFP